MPHIDYTYFQKRLTAIPNLGQANIKAQLNNYLDIYDEEYRVKVLGQQLNDEYIAGLEVQPPEDIEQRWLDLRDGAEFQYGGITYKWKGFLRATKASPIANYVMWHIVRDGNDLLTGIGVVKSESENSVAYSPMHRMVNIWNQMVDDNRMLALFIYANRSDYPNYKLFQCGFYPFYSVGSYPYYEWYNNNYCIVNNCDVLTTKTNIYGI